MGGVGLVLAHDAPALASAILPLDQDRAAELHLAAVLERRHQFGGGAPRHPVAQGAPDAQQVQPVLFVPGLADWLGGTNRLWQASVRAICSILPSPIKSRVNGGLCYVVGVITHPHFEA